MLQLHYLDLSDRCRSDCALNGPEWQLTELPEASVLILVGSQGGGDARARPRAGQFAMRLVTNPAQFGSLLGAPFGLGSAQVGRQDL